MGATPYRSAQPPRLEPPSKRDEVVEGDEEDVVSLVEGDHVAWVPPALWRRILAGTVQVLTGGATTIVATRELGSSGLIMGAGLCAIFAWQFRVLCLPPPVDGRSDRSAR